MKKTNWDKEIRSKLQIVGITHSGTDQELEFGTNELFGIRLWEKDRRCWRLIWR